MISFFVKSENFLMVLSLREIHFNIGRYATPKIYVSSEGMAGMIARLEFRGNLAAVFASQGVVGFLVDGIDNEPYPAIPHGNKHSTGVVAVEAPGLPGLCTTGRGSAWSPGGSPVIILARLHAGAQVIGGKRCSANRHSLVPAFFAAGCIGNSMTDHDGVGESISDICRTHGLCGGCNPVWAG